MRWLRRWLGLDEDVKALHARFTDLHDELVGLRSDLAVTFKDEHDPSRKSISDKLGQRAIARLKAEDQARRHTLGESER